ncbi:MAG: cytochrome P450 [Deltaproteobacteria bacterium]|nr:cytochrome P450 [Deltaproteobacteria bacterium]
MEPLFPEIDFATDELPNLHEIIAKIRGTARVAPVRYHGVTTWLITGHKELVEAFSDEEHFLSAAMYTIHSEPVMGKTIQCMSGGQHRMNRLLVSPAFLPSRVRAYIESLIEPIAHELIDGFAESGEAELVSAFTRPYPFKVITRLLGLPLDADQRFLDWALQLINYPWDPEGALAASAEFTNYLAPLVAERRGKPGDDLLSLLATEEVEGQRLTDEEIFSFVRLLFPAGSDTSYKALGSIIYAVLTHPEARRLIHETAERRWVVEEALRWEAPVALLPRMCSKRTVLGGVELEAGTPMLFGITAANRDPEEHPDPDRFDPSRREKNLSFGHGVHFCLGSHLARRELEAAVGALFERLPNLRLIEPNAVEIVGAVLRGPRELRVAF